jgi:uncharacterized protein YjbI with pentapeptide repeats
MNDTKELMSSDDFLKLTQNSNHEKLTISNKIIDLEIKDIDSFNLSDSKFYNCDFTGSIIFEKSNDDYPKLFWKNSIFEKCNFDNFSLFGGSKSKPIIMNNSIFIECNFYSVKFCNCTLANVEFKNIESFEEVEFSDVISWDESGDEKLIFSDIKIFKGITFLDSYLRGLVFENIKNGNNISFEDIEIDEIIKFKDIKIKSLDFIDTKYLDSEITPIFENCILEDVFFKDSSEFELFLESADGIILYKRDDSILTISVKCNAEQKSFTLSFLSNLKKTLELKYTNLVFTIIDIPTALKLIINSLNNIKHKDSLFLLEELTNHISKYFSDIRVRYNNFNQSNSSIISNNEILQNVFNLMGDCIFLNKLQSDEIVLKLSSKIDGQTEILKKMIKDTLKEIENDSEARIVKNSFISIGDTINVR